MRSRTPTLLRRHLPQIFANSCNTVFAPLGAELGGEKLVETSELFGFNSPPALFDADATAVIDPPQSTIPEDLVQRRGEVGDRPGSGAGDAAAAGHDLADDREPRGEAADLNRPHRRAAPSRRRVAR